MNFIVVVDQAYGIGKDNNLLTYLPEDLKYFRRTTLNKVVVMGRKTLESLPGGKPFDKRTNIVLTRDLSYKTDHAKLVHSFEELFDVLKHYPTEDVYICGGAMIYNALYPYCTYGYITKINETFDADTFLDKIEDQPGWELDWTGETMENRGHEFVWTKYKNTQVKQWVDTWEC